MLKITKNTYQTSHPLLFKAANLRLTSEWNEHPDIERLDATSNGQTVESIRLLNNPTGGNEFTGKIINNGYAHKCNLGYDNNDKSRIIFTKLTEKV